MDRRRAVFFTTSTGIPEKCDKCGGRCKYKAQGIYECVECRNTMMDDYGKVRVYLEENGRQPAVVIAEETGVSVSTIYSFPADHNAKAYQDPTPAILQQEKSGSSYGAFLLQSYQEPATSALSRKDRNIHFPHLPEHRPQ